MLNRPYTDVDCRHEAARQYAEILRAPDLAEVGDEMQPQPIASTVGDGPGETATWIGLSGEEFHDARNEIRELLATAPDLSRWAVDLGANHLTSTTELAWGNGGWDLGIQIAHRPGVADELHEALVKAIGGAVGVVLGNRGLDCPRIT
ncbi:hypothetical protein [Streptomyces sp. B21-083]|uniref:hypothetical protein n=1 Tax=Streptomyces sp. B21-083 TaxID=3039410 RepID=UPI002FF1D367